MAGFGASVFEVALKYRTVYALHLAEEVWALHAFVKKSTQGIKTPKKELGK